MYDFETDLSGDAGMKIEIDGQRVRILVDGKPVAEMTLGEWSFVIANPKVGRFAR